MVKNMIRKSLAIGSAALLGASVFTAVVPASAAGELKLEASSGVGFAVPHGVDFGLKVSVNTGYDTDELQFLKYQINTAGSVNVYAADNKAVTAATSSINSGTPTVADTASKGVVDAATYASGEAFNTINLFIETAADASFAVTADTVRVTVTAFIDKDGDNIVDSSEWQASQEISFLDNSDYDFVNILSQPAVGDAQLKGKVTSSSMNLEQSISALNVDFTASAGLASSPDNDNTPSYDATDNELDYVSTFASGAIASGGGSYSAILQSGSTTIATSTRSVTSTTVEHIVATVAAGANNLALTGTSDDFKIASGTGSFVLKAVVETSADAAVKDKNVTLRITEDSINELNSGASFTAGGNTLTNADATKAEFITATAVSNALGEVEFTISYSGVKKTEAVDITLNVDGLSALENGATAGLDSNTLTATAEDVVATTIFSADVIDTDAEKVFATGSSFSLNYHVVDQFGKLFEGSGLTVAVTHNSDVYTGAVVGGKASVSFGGFDADNDGKLSMSADVTAPGTDPTVSAVVTEVFVGKVNAVVGLTLAGTYGTAASKTALNTEDTGKAVSKARATGLISANLLEA